MGTRLRATEATDRCTPQCLKVQLIEPDTMDMVSTDHAVGLMVADLRGCSRALGSRWGDPRGPEKKRDLQTQVLVNDQREHPSSSLPLKYVRPGLYQLM